MRVLVVNAGSTSLKLRLLDGDEVVASADGDLDTFLDRAGPIDAAGHRVVHGGPDFTTSVVVDDAVLARLRELSALAPLHNPPAIRGLEDVRSRMPDVPNVACFDTAFHASLPDAARTYPVAWTWTADWGVRRYGFHGLAHQWDAERAAALLQRDPADLRLVTCHLGGGASLAAVQGGRSVDTTMGFTPLDGVMMATRPGALDPGILIEAARRGLDSDELSDALNHDAGLAGVSGVSADLRVVYERADAGDQRCQLAVAVYVHRLRAGIAAMAAALDGVDAIAFSGGAGAGSARLRRETCAGLGFLGIALDDDANEHASGDAIVSPSPARAAVLVVQAREDLVVAREVGRLLA